jgi:hypothetical protein
MNFPFSPNPQKVLEAALKYRARGWRIMPLPYGKKYPPMTGWSENNTLRPEIKAANENTIRRWWGGEYKGGNIALCCGPDSGVFILDIDGAEAEAAIEGKEIPAGPQVKTAHGRHIYFRYPESLVIPPKVGLKEKMDIRGRGAYALLPPSLHPSGAFYEWVEGAEDLPIPGAPDWLLEWIENASPRQPDTRSKEKRGNGGNALTGGTIPEGERNDTLFRLASKLRRDGLGENSIEFALQEENRTRCNPPLSQQEVSNIARSVSTRYPQGQLFQATQAPNRDDDFFTLSSREVPELPEGFDTGLEDDYVAEVAGSGDVQNFSFGYAYNDGGNSQRLFESSGEELRSCLSWPGWMCWDGSRWEREAGHRAISHAQHVSAMLYAQAEAMAGDEDSSPDNNVWARIH